MGELTGKTFAGLNVRDAIRSDLVSTVYTAVDPLDDRQLVLRVVAPDLCATRADDRDLYHRFLRRAAAALTFEHLHAPRIEEVGEHRGRGYLVASSVDTVPLGEFIAARGPLDVDAALDLFAQVADVLDASHHAGLNHGAVNPTTLRIVPTAQGVPPQVNLTGFGIGALLELRLRRDRRELRSVDELLYVAPEQLRSQPLTARADQYAMACAFVHAVTGSPPFPRTSVGSLFGAHLFVEPTLPAPLAGGPIAKALAKEPRDRYATCGQLIADLGRARRSAENRRRAEVRRRETVAHPWLDDAEVDESVERDADVWAPGGAAQAYDTDPPPSTVDDRTDAPPSPPADDGLDVAASSADEERRVAPPAEDGAEPAMAGPATAGADAVASPPRAPEPEPEPGPPGDHDVEAPPALPVTRAATDPADGADDGISYTADGKRVIALPAHSGPDERGGGDALSNGRRVVAARTGRRAGVDDNSSTDVRTTPDMTYPTTGNESGAQTGPADAQDIGTGTTDDNDDVPLLSDVLRQRPQIDGSEAWRPSGALVMLFFIVLVATALVVWLLLS
jgi:serine/threonine protein kinase